MGTHYTVYFGTGYSEDSKGIYKSTLDAGTGELAAAELAAEANNATFLAISPDNRFLYACVEADGGGVAAWAIGSNGELTALNQQSTGGRGACHVWVDGKGRNVLAANYSDGSIACFPVRADGSLAERSAFIKHSGSGPDKARQESPHAHAIYTDPADRFVYACDLGTDEVVIYRFDPKTGTLSPNDPRAGTVPPGGGPRHFAMHPKGFAYTNNEMLLSVTAYRRDFETGGLTEIETVSTVPEGTPLQGNSTAEIFIDPSGRWLYVSNRGPDTIAVFAIGDDGRLALVEWAPSPAEPRGFGISPDGRWLVAAGQNDDTVVVYSIDAESGKINAMGNAITVPTPVCVEFMK